MVNAYAPDGPGENPPRGHQDNRGQRPDPRLLERRVELAQPSLDPMIHQGLPVPRNTSASPDRSAGLEKDISAVPAGLTELWPSGPVEGFVNKLKLVKRQGYGRAGFDLRRARVLAA